MTVFPVQGTGGSGSGDGRPGEVLRLAALYRYGVIDTPPEPQFDRLVRLAAKLFGLPMALISFIDDERQWFKANYGVPGTEVPRCDSFCSVTIEREGVLVIPDAASDVTFREYPGVLSDPHVRSYAGAPLVTPDGLKIGTFCVFGPVARTFTQEDAEMLESLASMAMDELMLRQALDELSQMAMNDALTGLPNRVQFRQALSEACSRAKLSGEKVVVGLLDLDRFKSINDTFGHASGDALLVEVARRLKASTSTGDVVARISGDEFVLLLTDVRSGEDVEVVTRRLEDRFAEPFVIGGQDVFVHWSLGLSVYPDDTSEVDVLLSQADAAMYRMKRGGGGSGTFHAVRDQRTPLEVERLGALHRAVDRRELRVYYQPMVDARTREVVGHEALLRWQRSSGLVSPVEFIPLAEASGLIVPIGRWVLQEAVEALRTGRLPDVSVNVSALEFRQPDFVPNLRRLLLGSGVDPSRLWLELTESSLFEPTFAGVLEELRVLGVRTALDDYGTGYSNLTVLSALPVQLLKIDRSFVADLTLPGPAGDMALEVIRTIVSLARAYSLPTIVEGVETEAQAAALSTVGADFFQGFLFGRPAELQVGMETGAGIPAPVESDVVSAARPELS